MVKVETDISRVIYFDGVCNLCNGAVNFIIDRDPEGKFKFASLQSNFGQQFLSENNKPLEHFNSILYQEGSEVYTKSTAALKIAKKMSGAWPLFYAFIIVPPFIRDAVYDLIARNRYGWFGKLDQCRVPTPELRERFLD